MPYTNREGLRPIYAQSARENELLSEIEELESELRAFVAVALQHGMRDYCETRHPDLTREIEAGIQRSRERAEMKYAKILAQILRVPGFTPRAERPKSGPITAPPRTTSPISSMRCKRSASS